MAVSSIKQLTHNTIPKAGAICDQDWNVMIISDLPRGRQTLLEEMRAIDNDKYYHEVLVVLTAEKTDFYLNYVKQHNTDEARLDNGEKYLKLHDKHENARPDVLGAEHALCNEYRVNISKLCSDT